VLGAAHMVLGDSGQLLSSSDSFRRLVARWIGAAHGLPLARDPGTRTVGSGGHGVAAVGRPERAARSLLVAHQLLHLPPTLPTSTVYYHGYLQINSPSTISSWHPSPGHRGRTDTQQPPRLCLHKSPLWRSWRALRSIVHATLILLPTCACHTRTTAWLHSDRLLTGGSTGITFDEA